MYTAIITSARGVMSAAPTITTPEQAIAAFAEGYVQVAPTMFVSTAGAQIDLLRVPTPPTA